MRFTFTPISPNGYVDSSISVDADDYDDAVAAAVAIARAKGLDVIDVMDDQLVIPDE